MLIALALLPSATNLYAQHLPNKQAIEAALRRDPVHLNAALGKVSAMRTLLENGARPDIIITVNGHTPLITASRMGRSDIVKNLIRFGVNVNHQDKLKWASLHHSILKGQTSLDVVKLLINNGANINAQDHRYRTPLHRAAQYNHASVVRYLIENGADAFARDYMDLTPLDRAEINGASAEVITFLKAQRPPVKISEQTAGSVATEPVATDSVMTIVFGEYWLGMFILSAVLTWGIGLTPPLLIRFVFLKNPLSKWGARGVVVLFFIVNLLIFTALGSQSRTHSALLLVAWASYGILRKRQSKEAFSKTSIGSKQPPEIPTDQTPH